MFRLAILSYVIASAFGDKPEEAPAPPPPPPISPPYHPPPPPPLPPSYHVPSPSYHEPPSYHGMPYSYEYAVNDGYSHNNFAAKESSDGHKTVGSYTVHLPDGRIQTVTYTVDGYDGFVADVKYKGTPVYPKYEPRPTYGYKTIPQKEPVEDSSF